MTTKPDGGHAYPTNAYRYDESGNAIPIVGPGMTLRQYAAIQFRVPDSGLDWLDDMIRARMRDEIAERDALRDLTDSGRWYSQQTMDAVVAEREALREERDALYIALTRMVAMYESEFDHDNHSQFRPEWLRQALSTAGAQEAEK